MKPLVDIYNRKENFFDDIRLILATLVIFYHSYKLMYGENSPGPFEEISKYQLSLGSIAVYSFFVISGFF